MAAFAWNKESQRQDRQGDAQKGKEGIKETKRRKEGKRGRALYLMERVIVSACCCLIDASLWYSSFFMCASHSSACWSPSLMLCTKHLCQDLSITLTSHAAFYILNLILHILIYWFSFWWRAEERKQRKPAGLRHAKYVATPNPERLMLVPCVYFHIWIIVDVQMQLRSWLMSCHSLTIVSFGLFFK